MKKVLRNKNGGRGIDSRNRFKDLDTPLSKSQHLSQFDNSETIFSNIDEELDFLSTASDLDALSTDELVDMLSA